MSVTIAIEDDLVAGLQNIAKREQLSVEQLAIRILTAALEDAELVTPPEAVERIQATPPNPSQVRPATTNLADVLHAAAGDPCIDLESWNRQWSVVETEFKAITRANDLAEGRGRLN